MAHQTDPRMHSAEHLLNQAMVRLFGCGRCFTAHLGRKKSKCDYAFDRAVTDDEIVAIETLVNRAIKADLSVAASMVSRETAERQYDVGKLPAEVTGDLRIIHMGDFDACPCIGPHVGSTGEIGRFRITTTSFADGVLRIRFKLDPPSAVAASQPSR